MAWISLERHAAPIPSCHQQVRIMHGCSQWGHISESLKSDPSKIFFYPDEFDRFLGGEKACHYCENLRWSEVHNHNIFKQVKSNTREDCFHENKNPSSLCKCKSLNNCQANVCIVLQRLTFDWQSGDTSHQPLISWETIDKNIRKKNRKVFLFFS